MRQITDNIKINPDYKITKADNQADFGTESDEVTEFLKHLCHNIRERVLNTNRRHAVEKVTVKAEGEEHLDIKSDLPVTIRQLRERENILYLSEEEQEKLAESVGMTIEEMLDGIKETLYIAYKDGGSPVSSLDIAAHKCIENGIKQFFVDENIVFISEEDEEKTNIDNLEIGTKVIIADPIDGTRNIQGNDFCTAIGYGTIKECSNGNGNEIDFHSSVVANHVDSQIYVGHHENKKYPAQLISYGSSENGKIAVKKVENLQDSTKESEVAARDKNMVSKLFHHESDETIKYFKDFILGDDTSLRNKYIAVNAFGEVDDKAGLITTITNWVRRLGGRQKILNSTVLEILRPALGHTDAGIFISDPGLNAHDADAALFIMKMAGMHIKQEHIIDHKGKATNLLAVAREESLMEKLWEPIKEQIKEHAVKYQFKDSKPWGMNPYHK